MKKRAFKQSVFLLHLLIPVLFFCTGSQTRGVLKKIDSGEKKILLTDSLLLPECGENGEIVRHYAYTLCYDEQHEQARWVAYRLTREHLNNPNIDRSENFRMDPKVSTGSASTEDYKKTGFDRGHLCPAADSKWSEQAMRESFYMSNVAPQATSFNRGIWSRLEDQVREWAKEKGEIYIVTGGVLKSGLPKIGKQGVSVSQCYYKVLFDCTSPMYNMIGFILPNQASQESLSRFAVTIDSVESATGINFFPFLPDTIEAALEANCPIGAWFK